MNIYLARVDHLDCKRKVVKIKYQHFNFGKSFVIHIPFRILWTIFRTPLNVYV